MRVNISLEQLIFPRANPATAMPAFHSTHLSLNIWIKCCFAWISIFVAGLVHMHCNPHGQPHTRACTKCFKMTVKVPLCFPISSPQPFCPKWITSFLKNKKSNKPTNKHVSSIKWNQKHSVNLSSEVPLVVFWECINLICPSQMVYDCGKKCLAGG